MNMTVEEIIAQSVKEAKLQNQRERRNLVRRMLNYYGGSNTEQYIDPFFNSAA